VLFFDIDAQALQPGGNISTSALAVVGQESKGNLGFMKLTDEAFRTGYESAPPVDYAIHIN
jgi:hypothetical protein